MFKIFRTHKKADDKRKQRGIGLLEIIIAVGIIGGIAAYVVYNQTRAEAGVNALQVSQGTTSMVTGIKKLLGPSKNFGALTPGWLNSNGLVIEPYRFDGTNVKDPYGNTVVFSGATTTFALSIGGAQQLPNEVCSTFASTLGTNAQAIHIGSAAAVTAGAAGGGTAYKTAGNPALNGAALSECGTTGTVVAMSFQ